MPLNAKAADGMDLDGSALALWQEFLAGYFDGGAHQVGRVTVAFPKAVLRFQEASLPQPMKGVAISVVWVVPARVERYWDTLTAAELAAMPAGTPVEQERGSAQGAFLYARARHPGGMPPGEPGGG